MVLRPFYGRDEHPIYFPIDEAACWVRAADRNGWTDTRDGDPRLKTLDFLGS